MTVLLVSNFLFHAGRGSKTVCEELAERLSTEGIRVITTSSKVARIPRLCDMICSVLKHRNDYDLAHVAVFSGNAFFWAEAACAALRWLRKPYALTLHGGNLPQYARSNPSRVRRLLRSAEIVLAPSRYLLEEMVNYVPGIMLMPNALDLKRYSFRPRCTVGPKFVWLRAFDAIYNPMLAPKVLRRIVDRYPDAQLTMIGPDKGDGTLQATRDVARELGVDSRIHFAGTVPKAEVGRWLNQGDIFLNTTTVDNTPVSVLEAMASGLCVISTKVGGIPHLLTHGRDALLVPSDDPHAMALEATRLIEDPLLAQTISRNARCAAEKCDWSLLLPRWRSVFERLARKE